METEDSKDRRRGALRRSAHLAGRLLPWRARRWQGGPLRGWVDSADLFCVTGWAADLDRPNRAPNLDVWVNGHLVGRVECGPARRDAAARGFRGARSFVLDPSPHLREGWNQLELRFSGTARTIDPGGFRLYRDASALATRVGKSWTVGDIDSKLCTRWWQCDRIVRHVNTKLCGQPVGGLSRGLYARFRRTFATELPFRRGISVGCGTAVKEMVAISEGLVDRFVLYELSPERIRAGEATARRLGLENRVEFRCADAFDNERDDAAYDLVSWSSALHHMFDVDAALEWSHRMLRKGGVLLLDDYVGPTRMQFEAAVLEASTRFRESLPRAYLEDPLRPGVILPTRIERPNVALIVARDPSEAVDSSRILGSLNRHFRDVDLVYTGGAVYAVGLNDVLHNLVAAEDWDAIDRALALDDACLERGETLHAAALARR